MTKVNNQESFDGIPVLLYDGKFAGTFELSEEVGERVRYDDVVSFIVTTAAGKVGMGATKTGDMKRTNTFEVLNVLPIDAEVAKAFFDAGGAVSPQETATLLATPAAVELQFDLGDEFNEDGIPYNMDDSTLLDEDYEV